MTIKLTVFTPTFNRAYLLPQLYESLGRQTTLEFIWLIVDDGSSDDTNILVEKWQKEASFSIQYVYQKNQGMHGAHNTAYENCKTAYNVCIDSDDFMPDNGVERILFHLNTLDPKFVGLVGLDEDKNTGKVIGTRIPDELTAVKLDELYSLYGVRGDKKVVLNTEIANRYPKYPLYPNERFVPLDYKLILINLDFDFKPVNEIFCIVEYQEDGSTRNILKQYRRHPNGFAFSRVSRIQYGKNFKERFRNAIHLVSSAIFSQRWKWLAEAKKPLLIIFAFPFGILLNLYIRLKTKKE